MYDSYLKKKTEVLVEVIKKLGLNIGNNELPEKEGLWVYDFDKSTECIEREKDELYDLVVLKYKGELYTIRKMESEDIKIIGDISKNTNGVINELINQKKLFCAGLIKK